MVGLRASVKIFGQIAGGAITRAGFALQTFRTDGFQIAVERWRERAQFRRRFFGGLLDDSKRVLAQEWRPAGQEIKQDRAETVNVCRRCEFRGRSLRLFGRDIAGRSENRQRVRKLARRVEPFGQAEITHQRFAAPVEQNISRF